MKPDAKPQRPLCLLALLCMGAGAAISLPPGLLQFAVARITIVLVASVHALVILGACIGAGLLVVPSTCWRRMAVQEILLIALGCGTGLLSCGVLAVGLANWGTPTAHWCLLTVCLGLGLAQAYRWRSRFPARTAAVPRERAAPFALRFMVLVAGMLVVISAYAPPLLFDVTEYHLGAWADYSRTVRPGRFIPMQHNFYARFPFPIESLYFLGLSIGQPMDFAPKLLNAAWVLGCAGAVSRLLFRSGLTGGWPALGALLILAHPVMRAVSLDAYIDAPSAFLVLTSILALTVLAGPSMIVPAALLFGTALASKYTVAQLFLLPFAALYAAPVVVRGWKKNRHGPLALALLLGAIPLLFWLGKNVLLYGNPLEPFFTWLWNPNNTAAVEREKFYIASHYPQALWSVSYWTSLAPRLRELGWPVLAGLIFLAARLRGRGPLPPLPWTLRPARLVLFILGSYLLWNLVRESQNRFLLPSIALLICLVVREIATLRAALPRQLAVGLLGAWAGFHVLHQGITLSNAGEFAYWTKFELTEPDGPPIPGTDGEVELSPREEFYKQNLGALGELLPQLKSLPESAKVLMVYEARPYLVPRPTVYNTVWDDSELLRMAEGATDGAQVAQRLKAAGITHILVNREELRRYIQQYTRPSKLLELGIRPREDPAMAFYATPTPEDLFPPFYRDPKWEALRQPVLEFLTSVRLRSVAVTGRPPLEIYLTPVP